MEEELAARLREGQIAELVEDDEVKPREVVGEAALAAGPGLALEPVHEVDDVVEPGPGAAADAAPGDGDGEMRLAGSRAADEDGIALIGQEGAGRQLAHQRLVDGCAGELEVSQLPGQRQLGDGESILDRARLLLGDLGLEQVANDSWALT